MERNFSEADLFERCFVEVVVDRVAQRKWKKIEFASMVWPEINRKAALTKWSNIRLPTKTGKPQSISLADAQRMADVLGEDILYLIFAAKALSKNPALRNNGGNLPN